MEIFLLREVLVLGKGAESIKIQRQKGISMENIMLANCEGIQGN